MAIVAQHAAGNSDEGLFHFLIGNAFPFNSRQENLKTTYFASARPQAV